MPPKELSELDRQWAGRCGSDASYPVGDDRVAVDTFDRVLNRSKVYLFRRTPVQHDPAVPELKPRHVP